MLNIETLEGSLNNNYVKKYVFNDCFLMISLCRKNRKFADMICSCFFMIEYIFFMAKFVISGPLRPGRVRVSESSLQNMSEKT